jgi:hypothetical protein
LAPIGETGEQVVLAALAPINAWQVNKKASKMSLFAA